MIDILFIIPSLRSGGAEKVMAHVINELNPQLFRKHVIIINSKSIDYHIYESINVYHLNKRGIKDAFFDIYKRIRIIKPDIVFGSIMKVNIILPIYKLLLPKRIKWICRESNIISLSYPLYYKYPRIMKWVAGFMYPYLDKIIAQSNYMANDMRKVLKIKEHKFEVINNPVYIPKETINQLKNRDEIQFLSVGRLHPVKGFDRIIESLKLIEDRKWKYYIIGDGPEELKLKTLIKKLVLEDRIFLLGRQKPDNFYKSSDILLMGSHHEGFPNVVLEAGAFGLPTLGYNCPGGISEIIENGENGMLVTGTIIDYSRCLIKMMDMDFDSDAIRQRTQNKYSQDVILNQYEKVLKNLVEPFQSLNDIKP